MSDHFWKSHLPLRSCRRAKGQRNTWQRSIHSNKTPILYNVTCALFTIADGGAGGEGTCTGEEEQEKSQGDSETGHQCFYLRWNGTWCGWGASQYDVYTHSHVHFDQTTTPFPRWMNNNVVDVYSWNDYDCSTQPTFGQSRSEHLPTPWWHFEIRFLAKWMRLIRFVLWLDTLGKVKY